MPQEVDKREVRKYLTFFLLFILVLIDQFLKYYFAKFWPELVARNRGIAFGMLPSDFWVFVSLLLIGFVFYVLLKGKLGISGKLGLLMIAGGGLSNFVDRIIWGAVLDFIKIPLWPTTFNLADVFISLGVIILFLQKVLLRLATNLTRFSNRKAN